MKHYYIKYPRNFANEYQLFSVEANTLCRHERYRRQYDRAMSGYAPATIEPFEGSDYEQLAKEWDYRARLAEEML